MMMNRVSWKLPSVMVSISVMLTGCFEEESNMPSTDWLPDTPSMITTNDITSITMTSVVCGGSIIWGGRSPITARGVCWSRTSANPTITDNKTNDGTGSGSFTSTVTGLTANTKYYIRAYATNSYGTAYGYSRQFTSGPETPLVTTSNIKYYTNTSAKAGGKVTSQGLTTVTERGIFWSANPNPEKAEIKVQIGADTGTFSKNLMELTPETTYYIKAYAINSVDTAFGEQVSFKTNLNYSLKDFTIIPVVNFTVNSAEGIVSIPWDGGSKITEHGFCWSTSQNPATSDYTSANGSGDGNFIGTFTGLSANTTYYLRAYAINNLGTAYSNQVSFTTRTSQTTDIDGNTYYTQTIGSQEWMTENLKTTKLNNGTTIPLVTGDSQWGALTTSGYCWYNNSSNYKKNYGALYNWYTVNSGKLCPAGWHVATYEEWKTLINYLGGQEVAGGKMKETGTLHWTSTTTGIDNSSGFSALPGGCRGNNGIFYQIGKAAIGGQAHNTVPHLAGVLK